MCMLFGFSSGKRCEIKGLIKVFMNESVNHPHGWGIALYDKREKFPLIIKEPVPAYKSSFLNESLKSVPVMLAIAHIRYKTYGNVSYANTHPFIQKVRGIDWVVAHNGSVDYTKFTQKLVRRALGETDSEKVSCYIADMIDKLPNEHTNQEEIKCVERSVNELARYGKLALMITNGNILFIHTNCENTLYMLEGQDSVLFCTMPLTTGKWKCVPMNRILAFKDGERIYEGTPHNAQYFMPDEIRQVVNKGRFPWWS